MPTLSDISVDVSIAVSIGGLAISAVSIKGVDSGGLARRSAIAALRRNFPTFDAFVDSPHSAGAEGPGGPLLGAGGLAALSLWVLFAVVRVPDIGPLVTFSLEGVWGICLFLVTNTRESWRKKDESNEGEPLKERDLKRVAYLNEKAEGALWLWGLVLAGLGLGLSTSLITGANDTWTLISYGQFVFPVMVTIATAVLAVAYLSRRSKLDREPLGRNLAALNLRIRAYTAAVSGSQSGSIEGVVIGIGDVLRLKRDHEWVSEVMWSDIDQLEFKAQ